MHLHPGRSRPRTRGLSFTVSILLSAASTALPNQIWIPDNVSILRGVHFSFSDQCAAIGNTGHWQDYARQNKFALICIERSSNLSRGSIQGVLDGYAQQTGHPELRHVPIQAVGFSWSSGHAVNVSQNMADRCIALVPSGIEFGGSGDALEIPLMAVLHEGNNDESGYESVNAGRARGAFWAADTRYNGFHNWDNTGMLVLPFYDYYFRERVSLTKTALTAPVPLETYKEEDGWLIMRDRFMKDYYPTITPFGAYAGLKNNDMWASSEYMARVSQSYNVFHDGMFDSTQWEFYDHWLFGPYFATESSPELVLLSPPSSAGIKYPTMANYGSSQTIIVSYTGSVPVRKLVIYDGDIVLGTFTSSPYIVKVADFAPGYHCILGDAQLVDGSRRVTRLGVIPVRRPNTIECRFISPRRSDRVLVGANVSLEAEAVTEQGTISKVVYSVDGQVVGEATQAPFKLTWKADAAGGRVVSATVVGSNGDSSRVFPVKMQVVEPSVLTSLHVRPYDVWVMPGKTTRLTATGRDQCGYVMSNPGSVSWSVDGGGSIDNTGLLTAASTAGGPYTVTAQSGAVKTTVSLYVSNRIRVNFQPGYAETPDGFMADAGQPFGARGNGYSYGWNKSVRNIKQRPNHPYKGAEYTTFIPMHSQDQPPYNKTYSFYTWEMEIPNGEYKVHIVAGDIFNKDIAVWQTLPQIKPELHTYKMNVEDVLVVDGQPTNPQPWVEGTKSVTVSDGRLTISNATGQNWNKICFVEIMPPGDDIVVGTSIGLAAAPSGLSIEVLPGRVACRLPASGVWRAELLQLSGRRTNSSLSGNSATFSLRTASLTPGTYVLRIISSAGSIQHRVAITR